MSKTELFVWIRRYRAALVLLGLVASVLLAVHVVTVKIPTPPTEINSSNPITIGPPTGADKGAGTINIPDITRCFVNGVPCK